MIHLSKEMNRNVSQSYSSSKIFWKEFWLQVDNSPMQIRMRISQVPPEGETINYILKATAKKQRELIWYILVFYL